MTDNQEKTAMQVERGSMAEAVVREAFESGHSLDRIAQVTFERKKLLPFEFIGFTTGLLLSILGMLPVSKYVFEDGGVKPALVGGGMIVCGLVIVLMATVMDARRDRETEEAYREHHDKVRRNLLERLIRQSPTRTDETDSNQGMENGRR